MAPTAHPGMNRADFLKRAAALGALASAGSLLAAAPASATTDGGRRRGLTHRAVMYDTGTDYSGDGALTREVWSDRYLHDELHAIERQLHCNSVVISGSRVERLTETARAALERGLHVWVQPRLFDRPQREILDHLARTAREAECLRAAHGPETILVIGCEYILFTPGIVPGRTFMDRIAYLTEGGYDFEVILRRLNAFVHKAVAVARRHFHGRITYGASEMEWASVDWSLFDIVGLDYYTYHRDQAGHTKDLAPHRRWRKPIMILEFGCCTYRGAAKRGGDGWDAVDLESEVPRLRPGIVRDEREQAEHIAHMMEVFEAEGLFGASPYEFMAPDMPHLADDPVHDLDTAAYGLVKMVRRDWGDPKSPYHWEPKQSFHALAAHNGAHRAAHNAAHRAAHRTGHSAAHDKARR
ncbi:abortive phage infection protein [Streptomyces sp. NPDC059009]|uniref:abortive phage infection protein n=1 Tax=Streptomyces sp. NPDC059009 TaxID=3346694 RepID=UPI0036BF4A76